MRSLRVAVAATLAYVVSLPLTDDKAPVLAPLAALLVMQATVRRSLVSGARRVLSVCAGVILAAFLSSQIGLTWWSVGLAVSRELGSTQARFTPTTAQSARNGKL